MAERDTPLALPDPARVGLTEVRSVVIPETERLRRQIAVRGDLGAARDLCRQLEAFRKYLSDRQGRDLLAAECRRTEMLIGKLLGPGEPGRPSKDKTPPASGVSELPPRGDRDKFRLMCAHETRVEEMLAAGTVARNQILHTLNHKNPDPKGLPRLANLESLLSEGLTFGTIYADPPWKYGNQATRAATDNHYPTLTIEEIAALPVGMLAAERAHLWLWTTNGFLFECPRLFAAWGFEFKSSYVWVKPQIGIGNYLRNAHELLLLAVRGGLVGAARDVRSWGEFDRHGHSAKPEQIRHEVIERVSPGPRLELFGRKPVEGWTVCGNQVVLDLYDHDVITETHE